MDVLEVLADHPMRAKDVVDRLGISWTTGYRTLANLVDNGYLKRDGATGYYYIGARLYYIGTAYIAHLPILQISRPYLKEAAVKTGATVQLAERDKGRSIVLNVVEPESEHIPKTMVGYHFPLHCGSKGHILLAYADPAFIEEYLSQPLEPLTAYTITDPDELRWRLEEVRAQEYAVTTQDIQVSTGSVAAAVRDETGDVIASVCLIVTLAELEAARSALVDVALNTALVISQLIGWRPGLRSSHGAAVQ
jgi:DNA-binding IclR family transcriptional regulator